MNINRHNYEEFFLLYVDHELTAAERMMVETFVEENPDLKPELELLQQTTFTGDLKLDEVFKKGLLQPLEEISSIREEKLLLYIDNELDRAEKEGLEKEVVSNKQLQKELHFLQQTKLVADASIVFPDKSLLYKEPQPARVFYLSTAVKRWSAAAAILLLLASGWWLMYTKNVSTTTLAGTPNPVTEEAVNPKVDVIVPPAVKEEMAIEQPKVQAPSNSNQVKQQLKASSPVIPQQKNDRTIAVNKKQEQPNIQQPPVIQQPNTRQQDAIVKTDVNPEIISNNPTASSVQPETSTAKVNYSFVSNDSGENEESESGFLNERKQRSSGLKGLIKRAKRTFERRTGINTGEGQVHFAVFTINTQ